MITGVHTLLHSRRADEMRAFFRDVLGLPHVDAGDGWLIFALPPGELAVHPTEDEGHCELYLMCDDVHATVAMLAARGVEFVRPVTDAGWGLVTAIRMPDGGALGLYQPRHRVAHGT